MIQNDTGEVVFTVEPSKRKSVKKARVSLAGKLNLYNAVFIRDKVVDLVQQYDILDFKLEAVTEIDISAIQIMYYFKTMTHLPEKSISFQAIDLPAELGKMIYKCKYNKVLFRKPSIGSK